MSIAEARALCPSAQIIPFDPQASRQSLHRLAEWAMRFSPTLMVDGQEEEILPCPTPSGLLLDVTGTAHLFGGEALFVAEVAMRFRRLGLTARVALAPTIGAAWALARFAPVPLSIVQERKLTSALETLPIEALRLPSALCRGLTDVGIERIQHLLALPRESLLTRFVADVLQRLDQALGRIDERIEPIRPTPPLVIHRLFDGASTQLEAVLLATEELIRELATLLLVRESGVRGLRLELDRMNDPPVSREISLGRPTRNAKHLWSLLRPKVEGMHMGHGVEGLRLTATWIEKISHGQSAIWKTDVNSFQDQELQAFIDTLVNRWGTGRVLAPVPAASHVPEQAYRLAPVREAMQQKVDNPIPWLDRPSCLLENAEPAEAMALQPDYPPRWIRWRGESHDILTGIGPERIVVNYSPSLSRTRDYFKVQLTGGRWLWVYRELETSRWFVHGIWA